MELTKVFTQTLILFLLMVMGYWAARQKLMDADFNSKISRLLVKVAVPCMIIASVGQENPFKDSASLLYVLGISALVNFSIPFLASLFVRLLRVKEDKNVYQFMFSLTNAGFMGLPLIQAIFGNTALAYAAMFLLPNNLLAYVYGINLFQKSKRFNCKMFFNSAVVCSLIACFISFFHIQEPEIVYDLTNMVGSITTPLAMMMIGASLADVNKEEIINDKRLVPFTLIKMLVIPVLYFIVLSLFVHDQILLIVCVMMMAMPVASNAVIFSSAYGGNVSLSSRCVFITSTISVITIPLISMLFLI